MQVGHPNLGCAPYARNWVFFANLWNSTFCLLQYSACKKATAMIFIWGDRWYPAVRFEYKTVSERYLVAELWAKHFWVSSKKLQKFKMFKKHPKMFYLYLSNQISLRGHFVFKTNGRISFITSDKDHCCSFFTSWVIKQQKTLYFEKFEKTPNFGRSVHTLEMTTWRKHLIL